MGPLNPTVATPRSTTSRTSSTTLSITNIMAKGLQSARRHGGPGNPELSTTKIGPEVEVLDVDEEQSKDREQIEGTHAHSQDQERSVPPTYIPPNPYTNRHGKPRFRNPTGEPQLLEKELIEERTGLVAQLNRKYTGHSSSSGNYHSEKLKSREPKPGVQVRWDSSPTAGAVVTRGGAESEGASTRFSQLSELGDGPESFMRPEFVRKNSVDSRCRSGSITEFFANTVQRLSARIPSKDRVRKKSKSKTKSPKNKNQNSKSGGGSDSSRKKASDVGSVASMRSRLSDHSQNKVMVEKKRSQDSMISGRLVTGRSGKRSGSGKKDSVSHEINGRDTSPTVLVGGGTNFLLLEDPTQLPVASNIAYSLISVPVSPVPGSPMMKFAIPSGFSSPSVGRGGSVLPGVVGASKDSTPQFPTDSPRFTVNVTDTKGTTTTVPTCTTGSEVLLETPPLRGGGVTKQTAVESMSSERKPLVISGEDSRSGSGQKAKSSLQGTNFRNFAWDSHSRETRQTLSPQSVRTSSVSKRQVKERNAMIRKGEKSVLVAPITEAEHHDITEKFPKFSVIHGRETENNSNSDIEKRSQSTSTDIAHRQTKRGSMDHVLMKKPSFWNHFHFLKRSAFGWDHDESLTDFINDKVEDVRNFLSISHEPDFDVEKLTEKPKKKQSLRDMLQPHRNSGLAGVSTLKGGHHPDDHPELVNLRQKVHSGFMDVDFVHDFEKLIGFDPLTHHFPRDKFVFHSHSAWSCLTSSVAYYIELLVMGIACFNVCTAPFVWSFFGNNYDRFFTKYSPWVAIDIALDIVYAWLMFLRLFISIIDRDKNVEIVTIERIRRLRFQNPFYLTCLSSLLAWPLMLSLPFGPASSVVCSLLLFLRCCRAVDLIKMPEAVQTKIFLSSSPLKQIFRGAVYITVIVHVAACFWAKATGFSSAYEHAEELQEFFYPGVDFSQRGSQVSDDVTGFFVLQYNDGSRHTEGQLTAVYLASLCEAFTLIVGATISIWEPRTIPDFYLKRKLTMLDNRPEALGCALALMAFGFVCHSVVLSVLVVAVQNMTVLESKHQETLMYMNAALDKLGISKTTKKRINCLYQFQVYHYDRSAHAVLFNSKAINSQVLLEIKTFLYYNMIVKSSLFGKSKLDFIYTLINYFEDEITLPGDYVCKKGDIGREMFFILKGEASVLIPDFPGVPLGEKLIKIMGAGDHFGEMALVMHQQRRASVRANCYSVMLKLTAKSFAKVIDDFPEEKSVLYDKVESMAAAIVQQNNSYLGRNDPIPGQQSESKARVSNLDTPAAQKFAHNQFLALAQGRLEDNDEKLGWEHGAWTPRPGSAMPNLVVEKEQSQLSLSSSSATRSKATSVSLLEHRG